MQSDNIKWFDTGGFDHLLHVEAEMLGELGELMDGAIASIVARGGTPSRNLPSAPRAEAVGEAPRAVTPPATAQPVEAPRAVAPAPQQKQGKQAWITIECEGDKYKVVTTEGGDKRYAKVFCQGGNHNFNVHGVRAWPEVFADIGIDIESIPLGEYKLPADVTSIAVLYNPTGGRNGTGAPVKVSKFRTVADQADQQDWADEEALDDIPF